MPLFTGPSDYTWVATSGRTSSALQMADKVRHPLRFSGPVRPCIELIFSLDNSKPALPLSMHIDYQNCIHWDTLVHASRVHELQQICACAQIEFGGEFVH